jgi:hypothetical protein
MTNVISATAFLEKNERNKRVQARYDAFVAGGKGHYETLFRIVREEIEAERERCARTAEQYDNYTVDGRPSCVGAVIAAAIRGDNDNDTAMSSHQPMCAEK